MDTIIIPIIQIRKQTIQLSGLFKVIQLEIVAPAVNPGSSDPKIHVFRVVEKTLAISGNAGMSSSDSHLNYML